MSVITAKGPIFDPGLCRCCGAIKKCRLLNVEYYWNGQKELYSEMFIDCFGLLLSHLDGEARSRLICATCVSRLREAAGFRRQVLQCEQTLLSTTIHGDETDNRMKEEVSVKEELLNISIEPACSDYDDPCGQLDNEETGNKVKREKVNVKKEILKVNVGLACSDYDSTGHVENEVDAMEASRKSKRKSLKRKLKSGKKKKSRESTKKDQLVEVDTELLRGAQYQLENQQAITQKQAGCKTDILKLHHNVLTIIENSYVCPFDTSFSDYFCAYCRQVFTDPHKLREHCMSHDPRTFRDVLANGQNNKKLQIDVYRIDCRLCPERINDLEHLKAHLLDHGKAFDEDSAGCLQFRLTRGALACTECPSTFGFFHALKKHMAEHFGSCICDVCGAHYFEERMLALHQKTHQRVHETFGCKECGKTFKSKYTRYIHTARAHTKEAAYQCNKCDEVFFSYTLRYRHMIQTHGVERTFPCEQCDRSYDSRKSLREHNRRFHLKILKHQCDLCDKRFYLPSRLKEHMASHTGERNFRCEFCGKSYPRLRGLKVHMQSHAAEKKYKCDLCNSAFTQNVNLRNHVKRQHQGLGLDENYQE